jgi:hypothetical protein
MFDPAHPKPIFVNGAQARSAQQDSLNELSHPTSTCPDLNIGRSSSVENKPLEAERLRERLHPSTDPAAYALQSLEAALLARGASHSTFFKAPELAILELAPAIASLPTHRTRLEVVRGLVEPAVTSEAYLKYLENKLPHLLHFVRPREKTELLSHILSVPDRRFQGKMSFAVLRSAKDGGELSRLVTIQRAPLLLQTRHAELRELVAKAVLGKKFRTIGFPRGISRAHASRGVEDPKASREIVRDRLRDMYSSVKTLLQEIDNHSRLKNTRTAKEFRRSLKEAVAMLSPHVSQKGAPPRISISRYDGARLANLLALKVPTELKYGLHFARTHKAGLPHARPWSLGDIHRVLPPLKEIPVGRVVMTPLLHQIMLTTHDKVFATRSASGPIHLSDKAKHDHKINREFGGKKGLHVAMVHEVGHAIQIGKSNQYVCWEGDDGSIDGPSDPLYDFRRFCALSGWKIATERPWTTLYDNQAVSIDGELYPLKTPTVYKGVRVVFEVFSEEAGIKFLLARNAEAQFPVCADAKDDPWEEWAEGFSEYILTPERFVVFAPEKFLYFHVHFRKYEETHPVIEALRERLRTSLVVAETVRDIPKALQSPNDGVSERP